MKTAPHSAHPGLVHARPRETLDPESWDDFRDHAHALLDELIDFQRDASSGPAWRPFPAKEESAFETTAPTEGVGVAGALSAYRRSVLPWPTGLHHPRWWGWAGGNGTPTGMLAAMIGAALNALPGNFNDSATRVEAQVMAWMKEAFGFPQASSGIVTGGASISNLVALIVARDSQTGHSASRNGVHALESPLSLYVSAEVHSSIFKAAQVMGIGREAVRVVSVDDQFRMRLPELVDAIVADRRQGRQPFAVVGTAGTINTGSSDDLDAIADIAVEEGLWFHVDGAFGAMAALSPALKPIVRGLERADSLAFDFHKWMNVNYEAGGVLIRDADAHAASFSGGGDYLRPLERGTGSWPDMAGARGLQLSRGFKALKPWLMILEHGLDKFGRIVEQGVRQALHAAERIDASTHLHCVAPVALNVVAFRCVTGGSLEAEDELNRELLMRLQERGIAIPSSTLVDGRFTLRVCFCNHRSTVADIDDFVGSADALAAELLDELDA